MIVLIALTAANILFKGDVGSGGTFVLCDTGSLVPLPMDFSAGLRSGNIVPSAVTGESFSPLS